MATITITTTCITTTGITTTGAITTDALPASQQTESVLDRPWKEAHDDSGKQLNGVIR
jgi:hypothetical protein